MAKRIRILPDSIAQAYGGNALKEDGPDGNTIEAQERAMGKAAEIIAATYRRVQKILVVHGNGPQVGWMLRRSELTNGSPYNMHPVHLRNVVASSQGAIGLCMAKAIVNADTGLRRRVTEIGTHVLVDQDDPAFNHPSKPIGDFLTAQEAKCREQEYNWVIQKRVDGPDGKPYRRVVASPKPKDIEEINSIRSELGRRVITICVGGGGVPFIEHEDGSIEWVDAVIDKDKAAALAAILLGIKFLAIFTAENGIYTPGDFKKKHNGDVSAKPIPQVSAAELEEMVKELPSGSMGPKGEAVLEYIKKTGNEAWVGPLVGGYEALVEGGGTTIVPG